MPSSCFHRPRRWNAGERVWMGYERKRGKLADLNALLRGARGDRFSLHRRRHRCAAGRASYVITLDTDTQLPRDAAAQLIGDDGASAEPAALRRREAPRRRGLRHPAAARRRAACRREPSRYARAVRRRPPGSIPTRAAVSDVYQDLFGEGSFIGKGIYDVDAFEQALAHRFPDNRILSHDLLEGCYARSGAAERRQLLYEDYPLALQRRLRPPPSLDPRRLADAGWLLPAGAGRCRDARGAKSAVGAVAVEDLRQPAPQPRAAGADAAVGAGLDASCRPAGFWTLRGRWRSWSFPPLLRLAAGTVAQAARCRSAPAPARCADAAARCGCCKRCSRSPACPIEACVSLDAIVRTIVAHARHAPASAASGRPRATSSRIAARRPAQVPCRAHVDRAGARARRSSLRSCNAQPGRAAGRGAGPGCCGLPRPCSPGGSSRPLDSRGAPASGSRSPSCAACPPDLGVLRDLRRHRRQLAAARQLQEHPDTRVAHRTSPTNIGLSLLANLAAHDFGYRRRRAADRPHRPARSPRCERLERYRGPLLQLVRHAHARAAAAALRFHGRQRQSGRPSADAAAGTAGACRPEDLRSRAGSTAFGDTLAAAARRVGRRCHARAATCSPRRWIAKRPSAGVARSCTRLLARDWRSRRRRRRRLATGNGQRGRASAPRVAAPLPRGSRRSRLRSRPGASPQASRRFAWAAALAAIRTPTRSQRFPRRCCRSSTGVRGWLAPAARDAMPALAPLLREAAARAAKRLAEIEALALQATSCPRRNTTSSTTNRATCWRSATTSTSAAATPATTTCLPRKRACAASSAIAQGQLAAGELVRAGPPADRAAASRCCCPGAARCSST